MAAQSAPAQQAPVSDSLQQLVAPLNHPTRLSILAGLRKADAVEFRYVRDSLQISDSVLSKQMGVLEDEGLIAVKKGFVGKRARTWLEITPDGESALRQHFSALQGILHSRFSNGGPPDVS